MQIITSIVWAVLPSLITGIILAVWERKQAKSEQAKKKVEDERYESEVVKLSLLLASAQLSYASALTHKKQHPGTDSELEDGIREYEKAMHDFRQLEREQMAKKL